MTTSNWIELLGLVLGGGGGASAIAKLTRLAVAVENVVEKIKGVSEDADKTADEVRAIENRLNKAGIP